MGRDLGWQVWIIAILVLSASVLALFLGWEQRLSGRLGSRPTREFLTGTPGTNSLPGMSVEFLITSLVVVLIPGTGVIYTVSSSIGGGQRRGLFAALGCTLGIVPHMLDPCSASQGSCRPGR